MPLLIFITVALLGLKINKLSHMDSFSLHIPQLFAQETSSPDADARALEEEIEDVDMPQKKAPQRQSSALARITQDLEQNKKTFNPLELEPSEVMFLMSLSKRREGIEQREKNYEARESLARAVERRIDQKINELSKIRGEIEELYAKIQKHNDETTERLVKVYESMKPKNAAQVFEKLDDAVAIPILEKMRPQKASDMMAKMSPDRAKNLTFLLAERRKLLDLPLNEAPAELDARS